MKKWLFVIVLFLTNSKGICQNIHEKILQNTMAISEITLLPSMILKDAEIEQPYHRVTATGFIIKHNDFDILITANHVIENMSIDYFYIFPPFCTGIYKIQRLNDNKQKLWIQHPLVDIAAITINKHDIGPTLTSNDFADLNYFQGPDSIQVGDNVNTIGFPMGLTIPKLRKGPIFFNPSNKLVKFWADMPIFPGCSGSCVYNDSGKIIGLINACDVSHVYLEKTEIFSTIYLNGAVIIPSTYILELLNNLR